MQSLLPALTPSTQVIHVAGIYTAEPCQEDQLDQLIHANIIFGMHLLEAMRLRQASRIINIGTNWQIYNQTEHRPANLYAATKQVMEDMAAYYADAYGFNVVAVRLYDTYGEDDQRKKILPLLIASGINQQTLDLSPGEQLIDLMHVDDAVQALDYLAQLNHEGFKVINLSSGRQVSLKELVKLVESAIQRPIQVNFGGRPYRQREVMQPVQGTPIEGWQPKISLEEGIQRLLQHVV